MLLLIASFASLFTFVTGVVPTLAHADAACVKKLTATGMLVLKSDPKTICADRPSVAVQDCFVELLTKGKGKLRNQDFAPIYALCKTDHSKEVRDCFVKHLGRSWRDTSYVPAQKIGDKCLLARKRWPVKIKK